MKKRLTTLLIAAIAILMTSSAAAQEQSSTYGTSGKMKDHWIVNLQSFVSIGDGDHQTDVLGAVCRCPGKYWGLSLTAQRKYYVYRNTGFWLSPGAGLNLSWARDTEQKKYTEFGLELDGLIGYTFPGKWLNVDVFGGIVGRMGLMKAGHGDDRYWPGTGYARIGFSLSRGHFSLMTAYDYAFTNYRHCSLAYNVEKTSAITIGIGYAF